MRKKQFYKKLLWSSLFLVLVYTCVSFAVFLVKNQEIVKYRELSTHESFMKSSSRTMDTNLKVGLNWIYQLRSNDHVEDYASSEEQDFYTITQIFHELKQIGAVFSDFGYRIGVSKPTDDIVITPSRTQSKESFFKTLNMTKQDVDELTDKSYGTNNQLTIKYFENNSYFTIVKDEQINHGDNVSFYLSFLKDSYIPDTAEGEIFGIYSNDTFITKESNPSVPVEDLLTNKTITTLQEENKYSPTYTSTTSGDYTVHMIRSDVLKDLYFVYLTPSSGFGPINQMLPLYMLGYLLLAIVLGVFLAYYIANRTYKPISRVFKVFQENSEATTDHESYDELKYIEENYIAVKKNNESLQKIVRSNGVTIKKSFLKNVMLGLMTESEVEEGIKKHDLHFLNNRLRVILIEFDNRVEVEEQFSSETIHLLKAQLLKNIQDELSTELELEIFELEYLRFGIIVKDEKLGLIRKVLHSAFIDVEQHSALTLRSAIGSIADKHMELNKSYSDAFKLLEYRYAIPEKTVITVEDLESIKDVRFYYPLEKERDLISFVVQGNSQKAKSLLNELLDENLKKRFLNKDDSRQFVFAIVSTINRISNLIDNEPEIIFKDTNLVTTLMLSENNQLLAEHINQYFEQLVDHINQNKEQMEKVKKDEMLDFIHNNYSIDLSLHDLAEHFNLSTGYISTLFKKYTGENFKDYLNIYRVKVSKQLLETKQYKIAEISEMVGCNNTNTFIRIFKKYEGTSPGKYMKNSKGIV